MILKKIAQMVTLKRDSQLARTKDEDRVRREIRWAERERKSQQREEEDQERGRGRRDGEREIKIGEEVLRKRER